MAQSETVDTGEGRGAGWSITATGVGSVTLVPEAVATVPNPCSAPDPCEDHETNQLLTLQTFGGTIAQADALVSQADAFKFVDVGAGTGAVATLYDEMDAASPLNLPTRWNTRGYGRVEGFSALDGTIRADTIEAETVSGVRDDGGTPTAVSASGARIVNLRLEGALGQPITGDPILLPIIPNQPNQTVFNEGGLRIVFWETNWNRNTGTTTDSQPVFVNTLRITDTLTGIDIAVAQAESFAPFTAPPPPPPPNDPPVANDDNATTDQNTGVDIDVTDNDTDPDGNLDESSVTIVTDPANGTVNCNDNICTYTPDPGYTGPDSFEYEVCDTQNECDTATVNITVNAPPPANNPPVAVDDSEAMNEGGPPPDIDVVGNDSDPDGDPLTVTAGTSPSTEGGEVVCDTDSCIYTPAPGFTGEDTFTYEICDPDNACDTATVTVVVVAAGGGNNPPVALDDSASTTEGVAIPVIDVMNNDSDPNGDAIAITPAVGLSAQGGAVSCTVASCSYTPPALFFGTDSFTYEVCDPSGTCDTATVTITVTPAAPPANQPPVAEDDTASTDEDTPVAINVVTNDSDPDGNLVVSTVSVTVQPSNGAVSCSTGVCTYTPDPGFVGDDTFTYRICDSDSACDTAVVTVTVNAGPPPVPPANLPPVANDDTDSTGGAPVTTNVIANDSDPEGELDPSSVTITQPPANGAVICTGGACTYTPASGFTGTDDYEYQVCDNQSVCDTATVTITVTGPGPVAGPSNQPPVAEDDEVTAEPGEPVEIVVVDNDSDPDGNLDVGTVTVVSPPANGAVICSQGACTYTPEPGYAGEDSFDYRVCDALGACTTATVTIQIPVAPGPSPSPSPSQSPDEPGGSVGEGGSPGGPGGPGPDGDPSRPDRDGQPSRPERFSPAPTDPAAPESGLNPTLGAPNPLLPLTGAEPGFYLALAWNLVLVGGLLLFLDARSRRAAPVSLPATLVGGTDLLERTEPPKEETQPATEPVVEAETIEPPVATDEPKQKKAPARKPAIKKTAPKRTTKTAAAKKAVAAKPPAKKAATSKKPAAAKASTVKKSTVAKRPTSAKKSTVAKKASSTKKSTVAKKRTARGTNTKKSTVKRSTARK